MRYEQAGAIRAGRGDTSRQGRYEQAGSIETRDDDERLLTKTMIHARDLVENGDEAVGRLAWLVRVVFGGHTQRQYSRTFRLQPLMSGSASKGLWHAVALKAEC